LLGNTERRLKIVTHTAEINRFINDFSALTKTTLRMDEKDTLKEVFLNAVMIYEGNDVAFNYEHFRSVIGVNVSTKPYYLLSEKSRTTLGNAIRAAKAH
jgi:nitrogen fixation/metabolism regulation signal transduction histidine kinase